MGLTNNKSGDKVRLYPETKRAICAARAKMKVAPSYVKLINAAIVKGLEALTK